MRKKSVKRQHGGVILKDPAKRGFQPIIDMLNSPGAQLRVISTSSTRAIILGLTVQEEFAEYYQLTRGEFSQPVTEYIFKVSVIYSTKNYELRGYKQIPPEERAKLTAEQNAANAKYAETARSFCEEANMQQYIWQRSVIGGRGKICPPIANFALLTHASSLNFINYVAYKAVSDAEVTEFKDYMLDVLSVSNAFSLGVIVMPLITKSVSLKMLFRTKLDDLILQLKRPITERDKFDAIFCVLIKAWWLIMGLHIIHLDLHENNALIYVNSTNEINCQLIDFGFISNLGNGNSDKFFHLDEKIMLLAEIETLKTELLAAETSREKVDILEKLIEKLQDIDLKMSRKLFKKDTHPGQMANLIRFARHYLEKKDKIQLYINNVVDKLKSFIREPSPSAKPTAAEMAKYQSDGLMQNINCSFQEFDIPTERYYSERAQMYYLFNPITGETKWETAELLSSTENENPLETHHALQTHHAFETDDAWQKRFSEKHQKHYFFNRNTRENIWEKDFYARYPQLQPQVNDLEENELDTILENKIEQWISMAKASSSPLAQTSSSPLAKASSSPLAQASSSPLAKASSSPLAKASSSPLAKASSSPLANTKTIIDLTLDDFVPIPQFSVVDLTTPVTKKQKKGGCTRKRRIKRKGTSRRLKRKPIK